MLTFNANCSTLKIYKKCTDILHYWRIFNKHSGWSTSNIWVISLDTTHWIPLTNILIWDLLHPLKMQDFRHILMWFYQGFSFRFQFWFWFWFWFSFWFCFCSEVNCERHGPLFREECSWADGTSGERCTYAMLWWGVSSSRDIASKGRKKGGPFLLTHKCALLCDSQNILMSFAVIGLSLLMLINSKEDSPEVLAAICLFQCQRMKLYVQISSYKPIYRLIYT